MILAAETPPPGYLDAGYCYVHVSVARDYTSDIHRFTDNLPTARALLMVATADDLACGKYDDRCLETLEELGAMVLDLSDKLQAGEPLEHVLFQLPEGENTQ